MHKTLLLLAVLSTLSCSVLRTLERKAQSLYNGSSAVTQEELRQALFDFSTSFGVIVSEGSDRIALETETAKLRRVALLWKIRMPPLAQMAAGDPNPRSGYVESLTIAVAQRQYFEIGAGRSIFGPHQSIAIAAAKEIEGNALRVGKLFLPAEKLEELHDEVSTLALANPLRGEFQRESIQAGLAKAETGGAFDDIIGIPMAPFRAIAGVESGAQAIREFNATAAQFTEIIDQLPQRMRWQAELLSYDLQEQGGVLDASLKSLDSVALSAERLSIVAESAPEDMRRTIVSISEELERRSATLKSLLVEYRAAVAETGTTATSVTTLLDALERTSEQLNQAGVAWGTVIAAVTAPSPPPPPGEAASRPFDILEYEQTAIAIRSTAEEVRSLLADVQKTEQEITTPFADRLLRNGIILIAVFFAALLGYRLISSRLAPSR